MLDFSRGLCSHDLQFSRESLRWLHILCRGIGFPSWKLPSGKILRKTNKSKTNLATLFSMCARWIGNFEGSFERRMHLLTWIWKAWRPWSTWMENNVCFLFLIFGLKDSIFLRVDIEDKHILGSLCPYVLSQCGSAHSPSSCVGSRTRCKSTSLQPWKPWLAPPALLTAL